jgi:CubicO group peptidase (beta-lactamase class C family)
MISGMKKRLALALAILFCAVSAPSAPRRSTAEIDKALQSDVDQKLVPGLVAMAATSDGVVYQKAVVVPKDAIFAIASMTKPVTSVAIMQLVEAGKIKLDEPAATYAPELKDVQVLENGNLRPPRSPPTIRQLLSHTSGFAYEFMNAQIRDYVAAGKLKSMALGDDQFLKAPLVFDPGTRWEYGISVDWLGRIVENVSGESLEKYFRTHIFDPLHMPDSFFDVPPEKQARMVAVYQRKEDGTLAELPKQPVTPKKFYSGGGGLYSTASDYLRFTRALLAGGKPVLKPETVAMMGQNQIGDLKLEPLPSLMPQFIKGRVAPPGDKFGLGFALNSQAEEGGRGPNTMVWGGVYNTAFWIDREKGLTAVLMMQVSPFADDGALKALSDFNRAVYAWRHS